MVLGCSALLVFPIGVNTLKTLQECTRRCHWHRSGTCSPAIEKKKHASTFIGPFWVLTTSKAVLKPRQGAFNQRQACNHPVAIRAR